MNHWRSSLLAAALVMTAMIPIADGAVANRDQDTVYPALKSMPAPEYPTEARDAKVEGSVLVRALVGVDGHVAEAFLERGDEVFAASALEAVAEAVFEPAMKDGNPIQMWVSIPFRFELD